MVEIVETGPINNQGSQQTEPTFSGPQSFEEISQTKEANDAVAKELFEDSMTKIDSIQNTPEINYSAAAPRLDSPEMSAFNTVNIHALISIHVENNLRVVRELSKANRSLMLQMQNEKVAMALAVAKFQRELAEIQAYGAFATAATEAISMILLLKGIKAEVEAQKAMGARKNTAEIVSGQEPDSDGSASAPEKDPKANVKESAPLKEKGQAEEGENNETLDTNREEKLSRLNELKEQLSQKEGKLEENKTTKNELSQEQGSLEKRMGENEEEKTTLLLKKEDLLAQKSELTKDLGPQESESPQNLSDKPTEPPELQEDKGLKERKTTIDQEIEQLSVKLQGAQNDTVPLKMQLESDMKSLHSAIEGNDGLNKKHEGLKQRENELKTEIENLKTQMQDVDQKIDSIKNDLNIDLDAIGSGVQDKNTPAGKRNNDRKIGRIIKEVEKMESMTPQQRNEVKKDLMIKAGTVRRGNAKEGQKTYVGDEKNSAALKLALIRDKFEGNKGGYHKQTISLEDISNIRNARANIHESHSLHNQVKQKENELQGIGDETKVVKEEIRVSESTIEAWSDKTAKTSERLEGAENKVASVSDELNLKMDELNKVSKEIEDAKKIPPIMQAETSPEIKNTNREEGDASEPIDTKSFKEDKIKRIEEEIASIDTQLKENESAQTNLSGKMEKLEGEQKGLSEESVELESDIQTLKSEINVLETEINRPEPIKNENASSVTESPILEPSPAISEGQEKRPSSNNAPETSQSPTVIPEEVLSAPNSVPSEALKNPEIIPIQASQDPDSKSIQESQNPKSMPIEAARQPSSVAKEVAQDPTSIEQQASMHPESIPKDVLEQPSSIPFEANQAPNSIDPEKVSSPPLSPTKNPPSNDEKNIEPSLKSSKQETKEPAAVSPQEKQDPPSVDPENSNAPAVEKNDLKKPEEKKENEAESWKTEEDKIDDEDFERFQRVHQEEEMRYNVAAAVIQSIGYTIKGFIEVLVAELQHMSNVTEAVQENIQKTGDEIAKSGDEIDDYYEKLLSKLDELEKAKQKNDNDTFRNNFV